MDSLLLYGSYSSGYFYVVSVISSNIDVISYYYLIIEF